MKKKIVWLTVSCLIVLSLVLASCAPAVEEEEEVVDEEVVPASETVTFPDENLEAAVRDALGKPETNVNIRITIPRLKWKTSKERGWNSKPQEIEREGLIRGEDLYLFALINDLRAKYDLLATLEAKGQKLQEAKCARKGMQYSVELNEFYDTIWQNKGALTLKLEVRREGDSEPLGTPEVLSFAPVRAIQRHVGAKRVPYDLTNAISLPAVCSVLRSIKVRCPKQRRPCREISQIYYDKIKGKKGTDRDRKDLIIRSAAFAKVIMDTYGDKVPIKRQKRWRTR